MFIISMLLEIFSSTGAAFGQHFWAGALVQWLKLPAWKVGDHAFERHSGIQVSKKQNVSSPLIRKY